MHLFMDSGQIPKDDVVYLEQTDSPQRFFPFCIFNSTAETPVHWSYRRTGQRVLERVELFATISSISFRRFAPFVLQMIVIKIGTDGTYKTGKVNLV